MGCVSHLVKGPRDRAETNDAQRRDHLRNLFLAKHHSIPEDAIGGRGEYGREITYSEGGKKVLTTAFTRKRYRFQLSLAAS